MRTVTLLSRPHNRIDDLAVLTPEMIGSMFDLDVRTKHEATGVETESRTVTVRSLDGRKRLSYDSLV